MDTQEALEVIVVRCGLHVSPQEKEKHGAAKGRLGILPDLDIHVARANHCIQ